MNRRRGTPNARSYTGRNPPGIRGTLLGVTTSTARVLALLEILQSGGVRTVPDLAARLGVDERTVRRYVRHLLDLGVPVDALRGRYGGYRIAPGHRMPPLMLTDDEALAVVLGLLADRPPGPAGASTAASGTGAAPAAPAESAAAKVRRVLPTPLRRRLDTLVETAGFTARPRPAAAPDAGVLLDLAEAGHHRRPVEIDYTDRQGCGSERTVLPYGLVAHRGRWYLTGADPLVGETRIFRVDRIAAVAVRPGSFAVPPGFDPVAAVLDALARTPWTHDVALRVRGGVQHIRGHFPADIAALSAIPATAAPATAAPATAAPATAAPARAAAPGAADPADEGEGWVQVRVRAERLEWIPAVLAALDRPFVIERPAALRDLVRALARRLDEGAAAEDARES
jgi:predicted DNA-binding transcriptional regulator YafY